MIEKLSFAVENIEFLEEENNSQFAKLKIDAFASGNNRHSLFVSEETLKRTAPSILQKPIMWAYSQKNDDATDHASTEIICGFIPHDSPIEYRKLEDGRTMMSIIGKLWTRYSGKLTDIFKRDLKKSVSVEMEVYEEEDETKYGIPEILNFCYTGITVLGDLVRPAIKGANAELVAFAAKEQKEYEEAYMQEFSNKYADIDFTIPKKIKENAKKSLEAYKGQNIHATSVTLAVARHIINSEKISIEKLKELVKFFNKKTLSDEVYMGFYGGKEASKWCKGLFDAVEEIDNKQLSYFEEGEVITFPYKSKEDMNPALKGIDPPISVSQGNEIAKQADAIGGEYGWPTAIKSWKSRNHVEDGKWVKNKLKEEEQFVEDLEKKELMAEEKLPESETKPEEEKMSEEVNEEKPKEESMAEEKPSEEDKEEEKEGEDKEEGKEEVEDKPKEEKMSLDANLDVAAYLAYLENATEANEELVAKYKTGESFDYAKIFATSKEKMCRMAEDLEKAKEDNDAYMSMKEEFEALKQYKADREAKDFSFAVEAIIAEVSEDMPKEEIDKIREISKKHTIETLSAFGNEVKAKAYAFSKEKEPKDGIVRMATGWVTNKQSNSLENGWVPK